VRTDTKYEAQRNVDLKFISYFKNLVPEPKALIYITINTSCVSNSEKVLFKFEQQMLKNSNTNKTGVLKKLE
jgi:hypothetical protein